MLLSLLAVVALAVISLLFFFPDSIEGNVLKQHDIMQGLANGQEGKAYYETTGETTRWTDALFGGMPNFQIAPSYPANSLLDVAGKIYMLGLPSPSNLLFAMMVGFFIMCLCFKMKWYTSLFASIAWGFSTYFIIIIGAGHIWKFVTLAYIPPTIGGIALIYRRKWLSGTALASLFGALQLQSNHPQMSYYFMFVIFFLVIGWLVTAIKESRIKEWGIATVLTLMAGGLALCANSASLINTWQYSKETVRGRATELTAGNADRAASDGMDRSAITAWSYGLDETWSLLIPNVKGGATIRPEQGENVMLTVAQTDAVEDLPLSAQEMQFLNYFPQYFGDQPMTNGPVYVGAFVLLLAILAMFIVDGPVAGPMKWALFASCVLAILLSWGHNFEPLTNFFIDNFPGYNKFRAVASILVVVEFAVPLLAAMCVMKIIDTPDYLTRYKNVTFCVFGVGAAICLIGSIWPSVFGSPFSLSELEQFQEMGIMGNPQYANVLSAVSKGRLALVRADSLRSLIFIVIGVAVMALWVKGVVKKKSVFVCMLAAVVLLDLFSVNKRYISSDSFIEAETDAPAFVPTAADLEILKDKSHYRVLDLNDFNGARSSYFHNTIGGYHAAKLTRYNDLLERQIRRSNPEVLDMLNTRYIIQGDSVQVNPYALGNAWFVSEIKYVDNADSEMGALDSLQAGRQAVADRSFSKILGNGAPVLPGDTIILEKYAPNRLEFVSRSAKGGVAVFSEIWFPWGWKATVDGKPAEIGRVNYVLRAMRLPAGEHKVVMVFDPDTLRQTNVVSVAAVIVIYVISLCALVFAWMRSHRRKENSDAAD